MNYLFGNRNINIQIYFKSPYKMPFNLNNQALFSFYSTENRITLYELNNNYYIFINLIIVHLFLFIFNKIN